MECGYPVPWVGRNAFLYAHAHVRNAFGTLEGDQVQFSSRSQDARYSTPGMFLHHNKKIFGKMSILAKRQARDVSHMTKGRAITKRQ